VSIYWVHGLNQVQLYDTAVPFVVVVVVVAVCSTSNFSKCLIKRFHCVV